MYGKPRLAAKVLGLLIALPFIPLLEISMIAEHPRFLKKQNKKIQALKDSIDPPTDREDRKRLAKITDSFNKQAGKMEDKDISLICHHNVHLRTFDLKTMEPMFTDIAADNAQVLHQGKNKYTVVVNLEELSALNNKEIEFAICHELSHIKNKDIENNFKSAIATTALDTAALLSFVAIFSGTSPLVFSTLFGACVANSLSKYGKSRKAEYNADKTAVTDFNVAAEDAQSALAKLQQTHFILPPVHPTNQQQEIEDFFASHPPTHKRIAALNKLSR